MRVLHIVKTTDGAQWAADQVSELVAHGIDVHVALPQLQGRFIEKWQQSGARLHTLAMDLPVSRPWQMPVLARAVRDLVSDVAPDIIHSHFFGTTVVLRYSLGRNHPTPRIFQVPGPLHMEHRVYRSWELSTAGRSDFWVASSRYILNQYLAARIPPERLFLSYYGNKLPPLTARSRRIRSLLGIGDEYSIVGNISHLYPPKYFLGQTKGLKRHEDIITALGEVVSQRDDVVGVLIGGQWGKGTWYESRLRGMAAKVGRGRILMPGHLAAEEARAAWLDFNLAVHVPISENCGGVIEPLLAGVPVIAAKVGGLPEVVMDGVTGMLIAPGNPAILARAINAALDEPQHHREMAERGSRLVRHMFDVSRTAAEIKEVYSHLLDPTMARPKPFDPSAYLGYPRVIHD